IVRVEPAGGDDWALGCVFARELGDADLESFGARRERHASADQRQWMRFPCNVKAAYQKISSLQTAPAEAQVLNISASGVGLMVKEQIEAGTLRSVGLQPPTGEVGFTMLACVVHVTAQANGDHALGCNFIRELADADLDALLAAPA